MSVMACCSCACVLISAWNSRTRACSLDCSADANESRSDDIHDDSRRSRTRTRTRREQRRRPGGGTEEREQSRRSVRVESVRANQTRDDAGLSCANEAERRRRASGGEAATQATALRLSGMELADAAADGAAARGRAGEYTAGTSLRAFLLGAPPASVASGSAADRC